MKLADFFRIAVRLSKLSALVFAVIAASVMVPQMASAKAPDAPAAALVAAPVAAMAGYSADHFTVAPGGYTPMQPTPGKGMPVDGGITFQKQYSPNGEYALWMHNKILMPLITAISLFVLVLLLGVMWRFRASRNPIPTKTSHNFLIEIIWIAIPTIILALVAIPSMDLLAKQYKAAPKTALTVKATGNQWFWSYSYPDNGGFEITSNMLPEEEAVKRGEPRQLAADYRMWYLLGSRFASKRLVPMSSIRSRCHRCGSRSMLFPDGSTNGCCSSRNLESIMASVPNCAAPAMAICQSPLRRSIAPISMPG